jgi:Na+/phosphate symporter
MGWLNQLLQGKIGGYLTAQIDTVKTAVAEKVAALIGGIIFSAICLLLLLFVLVFAGFAAIELFTTAGMSHLAAVLIVFGGYLFVFLVLLLFRTAWVKLFSGFFERILSEKMNNKKKKQ